MNTAFKFYESAGDALATAAQWFFVGTRASLGALATDGPDSVFTPELARLWPHLVKGLSPGDSAQVVSTLVLGPEGTPEAPEAPEATRIFLIVLSDRVSRHNAPGRPDALLAACRGRLGKKTCAVILVPEANAGGAEILPWVLALARAAPTFRLGGGSTTSSPTPPVEIAVAALGSDLSARAANLHAAMDGVRLAARLVDMPPNELGVDRFVTECVDVAERLGVAITIKRRDGLVAEGFGGLAAVGQAARQEPALVHLSWQPADTDAAPVAWVGKGIVYDTGGLSLKGKTDMPGMKTDMGGAAAVLGAFEAACRMGVKRRIDAVLCIAENAVGSNAVRPDDIIRLYSGKTIEINNTDAEGRLVLSDGVAFATKDLGAQIVCDLATLTGAQLVSTGKVLAAIVSNDEELETAARVAGRLAGEPVFPLPFAPELFRAEFASPVADLRNSVKDRANGQASCAAQFIAESLDLTTVRWLHVDLAGPAVSRDRGTGFGVGLLLSLFGEGATV